MKIILLVDVPKVGKRHEIKEVADGFARNVLLPSKKAVLATPVLIAQNKQINDQKNQSLAQEEEIFMTTIEKLRLVNLSLKAKASKEGNLFAAVKADDIVSVASGLGLELKKEWLVIDKPIKIVGEHWLELKKAGRGEKIKITIVAEK